MADNKTEVLIELKLQVKQLEKDITRQEGRFKTFAKAIGKAFKSDKVKKLAKAIKELTGVQKASVSSFVAGERSKETAIERTSKAIRQQQKEAKEAKSLLDRLGPGGRFVGGLGAGMGLGAGRQAVTARGLGGMLGRGVTSLAGGAASFITSGAAAAYGQYQAYGQALGGLVGRGTGAQLRGGLKAAGGVGGAGLGYGPIATAQQAAGISRATGNVGAVYRAQQFSRAFGLDVGEAGGYMGAIRQAGYGFGGMARGPGGGTRTVDTRGTRELTKIMEAGLVSGLEKARLPEFLQGVSNITQQVGGRLAGDVNVGGIAGFQAMLGTTGKAGMQGARGAAVAAQLNQAIMRPGGGEAGQAMMMQALGFGKPGGQRGYYEALKMQQGGMERPESVMDMFNEVYSQLGQRGAGGTASVNQEANLALSEMTGLSLDQVETLGDLLNSGKSQEEIMAGVKEQMEKAEPVEKQALKEMKKGFGGMVSYLAGIEAKQIAIGAKFSKVFERIQQLQLKALSFVADYVPKIEHWIKEAYVALKEIINIGAVQLKTGEQQAYKEMMAKSRKEMEELYGSAMSGSVAQRLKNLQQQEAVLKARIGKLTLGALRGGSMGGVNARATSAIAGMFGVGEGAETQQERRRAAMELRREMERIKAQKKVLSELRSTVGLHGRGGDIEKLLDVSQGEALGYGAAPTRLKHRLKMGAISQRLTRTGAAGGAERGMTKEELQQETGRGSRAGHDARTTKPKVTGGGGKGGKRKATGGRLTF